MFDRDCHVFQTSTCILGADDFYYFLFLAVGFHNGGVSMLDRALVEGLFLAGDLLVLCTTSTLGHGVNLPAHAVIIKSTQY